MSDEEQERVAEELRRIREGVRERALLDPPRVELPPARETLQPGVPPAPGEPALPPVPEAPDRGPVNEAWDPLRSGTGGGLRGLLRRIAIWLLRPVFDAQRDFNARQVQLDNALVDFVGRHFTHTHSHYDRVLGIHGRRMQDIDARHLILQEELVAHVHDLVKRIDLVLEEAERGRLSLTFQLRDLRTRLERLEERLRRG